MPVAGDSGLPRPRLTSLSHISKAHRLRNSSPEYHKLRSAETPAVQLFDFRGCETQPFIGGTHEETEAQRGMAT